MNKKIAIILCIVVAAAIITVAGYLLVRKVVQFSVVQQPSSTPTLTPAKIDFGSKLPTDFPTNIPLEQGVKITQSYSLNYTGQKQLSIVFASMKTITENYTLYADFLKKDGWTISNKYESKSLSSLYGKKGSNDINITISGSTDPATNSQISISVLEES